jgi:transposase-like protein
MMAMHRRFTPEFKVRVVLEIVSGAKRPAEVCREYRLKDSLLCTWRRTFAESAVRAFQGPDRSGEQARVAELERMVGRLTLENDVLKKASTLLSLRRDGGGT